MKKLIILCVLPIFFGFKSDQEIDEKKMTRDLEIAKNILATLIKSDNDSFFVGESIDASYIKGYGVVFSIPEYLVYFHSDLGVITIPEMPPIPDLDVDVEFYGDFDFSEDTGEEQKEQIKKQRVIIKEQEKEFKKHQKEFEKNREELEAAQEEMSNARKETVIEIRSSKGLQDFYSSQDQASQIDWEEIMITFMTDYADLIGQLQPDEKVIIKQNSPYNEQIVMLAQKGSEKKDEDRASGDISAMVLRKDIGAYKSGKINKNEFVTRIEIKKKEPQKKIADLEMFANIFDRYYSNDLTETFYSQGTPKYEVLEGFGVIFHIKAASNRNAYRKTYRSSGSNTWTSTSNEQKATDAQLYPKFKEDLKSFILDYGRTIRSLNDEDKILLQIEMNSCRDCNIPRSIEVSTKMSVLKQYDQQKLGRDKALGQIEIKEII